MRLIDADALEISTEFSDDGEYSWDIVPAFKIQSAPTIDAVPVVHGRWEYHTHTMQECSVCKKHTARHRFNYCPNCGARMDGE